MFEYEHKVVGDTLMISAGKMPTLANEASVEPPLTQITGADAADAAVGSGAAPSRGVDHARAKADGDRDLRIGSSRGSGWGSR